MGNSELVEINQEDSGKIKDYASQFTLENLLAAIFQFDRAAQYTSVGWQPGLQLELAFSRAAVRNAAVTEALEAEAESPKKSAAHSRSQSRKPGTAPKKESAAGTREEDARSEIHAPASAVKTAEKKSSQPADKPEAEVKKAEEEIGESGLSDTPAISGIQTIRDQWKEIRASAKDDSPETAALLNSVRNMEMHKGRLVLAFSSQLLQSKMENGTNVEKARKAIKTVTGMELEIDCRVAGKNENTAPDDPNIQRDGMVGTAISLGGKIIEES